MRADLDDLLADAAAEPTAPLDPDAVWATGRRRRLVRRLGTLTAGIAVIGLAVTTFAVGGIGVPTIEPAGEGAPAPDDGATVDTAETLDAARERQEELARQLEEAQERLAEEEAARLAAEEAEEAAAAAAEEAEAAAAAEAAMADPCAGHEHRTDEAFIEVVSPTDGQEVGSSFELIGCSNVYEATVRFRITDAAGAVVVDHFTTATAGSGAVGEYREEVELGDASGELTLEVFWDDAASGEEAADDPERDKVTRTIVAG